MTRESVIPIDVPNEIRRVVADELDYDDNERLLGLAVDLNGDSVSDYLVQSASSLCGNGGCLYAICDGATRKKLGQFLGSPLYVSAERTRGYPNIATYSHQSAESGTYTEYRFDGKTYTVSSTRTLRGAEADRFFESMRQWSVWRPAR